MRFCGGLWSDFRVSGADLFSPFGSVVVLVVRMAPVLQVLDLWLVGFGDWFPASLRLAVRFFLTAAMGAPKDIITSVAKNRLFLDHRKGFVFFGVKSSSMLLSSSYIFGLESFDRYAPRE